MALHLAERGFDVAVHYAGSREAAGEVAGLIRDRGRKAATVRADLTVEAETQGLVPAAMEALGGPLGVLVNNASIFEYDTLDSADRDGWDRHMESNLRAPFVLTQELAAHLPEPAPDATGEPLAPGLVVNMIDQKVRKLTPEHMTYTIAKAGLWTFTQIAAQALGKRCRVNAIGPGPTLQGARQPERNFQRQREATILERGSNPADICAALGYFLDAPAVTGQMLCVDGGQHLIWQTADEMGVPGQS